MRKVVLLTILLVGWDWGTAGLSADKGGKPKGGDIPVDVYYDDTQIAGEYVYRIHSGDQVLPYVAKLMNSGPKSIKGNLTFCTSDRRRVLDFGEPVIDPLCGNECYAPSIFEELRGGTTGCHNINFDLQDDLPGGLLSLSVGTSHKARAIVGFPDYTGEGFDWSLAFGTKGNSDGGVCVTRIDAATWEVLAIAGETLCGYGTDEAVLYRIQFGGPPNQQGRVMEGGYLMPFRMTVTLQ